MFIATAIVCVLLAAVLVVSGRGKLVRDPMQMKTLAKVGVPDHVANDMAHLADRVAADEMSAPVVHALEEVDVEDDHRQRRERRGLIDYRVTRRKRGRDLS